MFQNPVFACIHGFKYLPITVHCPTGGVVNKKNIVETPCSRGCGVGEPVRSGLCFYILKKEKAYYEEEVTHHLLITLNSKG